MRRFLINFRQTAKSRAADFSNRAYQHYRLRIQPHLDRIQKVWHASKEALPHIKNTKSY